MPTLIRIQQVTEQYNQAGGTAGFTVTARYERSGSSEVILKKEYQLPQNATKDTLKDAMRADYAALIAEEDRRALLYTKANEAVNELATEEGQI